uniref:Uncharacterized protein n=1 Tax=Photinus pyralis TaxID=7054 RepID=A0A1Y1MT39_PHOPY
MGSVQHEHLNKLAREIWQWCEERNIWIFASYINTKDNWEADAECRALRPETEWSLADSVFEKIKSKLGIPDIDLFASIANRKCIRYVSWQSDPEAVACDAFTLSWSNLNFYAFPPFSIILRVLQKINTDDARGIVVVPYWPSQPWFPLFVKLAIDKPLYFGSDVNMLLSPYSQEAHPLASKLTLVACRLSGKH